MLKKAFSLHKVTSRFRKREPGKLVRKKRMEEAKQAQVSASIGFLIYGLVGIFYGFLLPNTQWLTDLNSRLMIGIPLVLFCVYSIYNLKKK